MSVLNRQGVCFTGKGNLDGKLVTRDVLDRVVRAQGGIHYETYSGQIDILVSSRTDTSKWQKAVEAGKRAITYDEFWQILGVTTHAELHQLLDDGDYQSIDRARRLQEQAEAQERVEEKRRLAREAAERKQAAMDQAANEIEGWGMF